MSAHEPGDAQHRHESELLHAQEHKGYGDDEGERAALLDETTVRDNPDELRYELLHNGQVVGEIRYRTHPGSIALVHTDVDPAYEGHRLATKLIKTALDDLRARGLQVVPICPLVNDYIGKHPEYRDLVAEDPATPE
jgi:predicted GNAT family acetyltransferase